MSGAEDRALAACEVPTEPQPRLACTVRAGLCCVLLGGASVVLGAVWVVVGDSSSWLSALFGVSIVLSAVGLSLLIIWWAGWFIDAERLRKMPPADVSGQAPMEPQPSRAVAGVTCVLLGGANVLLAILVDGLLDHSSWPYAPLRVSLVLNVVVLAVLLLWLVLRAFDQGRRDR